MKRLLLLGSSGMLLTGCSTEWQWPMRYPDHLRLTMTGVTVSWPVILGAFAITVLVLWVKAKIRKDDK